MPVIDTVAKFANQLTLAVDLLYEETGKSMEETFKDFMKEGDASDIDYRTSSIVGFGQHVRTGEIGQIFYDALTPGRDRTITWSRYTIGWRASDRLMRDSSKSSRPTPSLRKFLGFSERSRKSASWTMEEIGAQALIRADEATATATWMGADVDGVALASNAHPLIGGGTWSNLSAAPLSQAAIEAAITMLRQTPEESGQNANYRPSKYILIVGPALEFTAYTILNTDMVLGSNFNNQMGLNKYKGSIKVVVNGYLDNWDGWVLMDADDMPFEYFMGLKPTVTSQRDFETSAHLFKSEFEFGIGVPRGARGMVIYPGT